MENSTTTPKMIDARMSILEFFECLASKIKDQKLSSDDLRNIQSATLL